MRIALKNTPMMALAFLAFALPALVSVAVAEDIVYPADSGVINVKTAYGAKGDGVTDDTAAILNAITNNINTTAQCPQPYVVDFSYLNHILYFPNGVYLVSNCLTWVDAAGNPGCYLSIQGESQSNTIIKLKDNAPGYADKANPQAVVHTESFASPLTGGYGNQAYGNNICNLTVDTGHGNHGAIGIDYQASNQGVLKNVTIESDDLSGCIGLKLWSEFGPGLIKNLTVLGFDLGISVYQANTSTFEHITLKNQQYAGLQNDGCIISIEDLNSSNSVPAILNNNVSDPNSNPEYSLLVLIGANLNGGASTNSAIINNTDPFNGYNARLYARNVTTTGYQSALRDAIKGTNIPGVAQTEWISNPVISLFSSPQSSLNLPIQDTPEYADTNLANWVNIQSNGAVANGDQDNTAAIQAAIDAGKTTVYFPIGLYHINNTVHVRGNVRRLIGFGAVLKPSTSFSTNGVGLRIESNAVGSVTIEGLDFRANYEASSGFRFPASIEDAASQPVIIKDLSISAYRNQPGVGTLFIEDVAAGLETSTTPFSFNQQTVWARQLNPESNPGQTVILVSNNGGKVWISGLKTEGPSTIIQTTGGGQTELLGGAMWQTAPYGIVPASIPAFVSVDSSQSLIYGDDMQPADWEVNVQETRAGITRYLYRAYSTNSPRAYPRPPASAMPLFTGYPFSPVITSFGATTGGRNMSFTTTTGVQYEVMWRTNLINGSWLAYTNNLPGSGTNAHVIFTNAVPQAFFQILANP